MAEVVVFIETLHLVYDVAVRLKHLLDLFFVHICFFVGRLYYILGFKIRHQLIIPNAKVNVSVQVSSRHHLFSRSLTLA